MAPKAKEKPKPSPNPSSQPLPPIEDLFTTLNRHIQRSEYKLAVKIADQVLSVTANDEDALRCKIVAFIKDDDFDSALSTIMSCEKAKIDFSFFKAYCLYRQNKLDEALKALNRQEGNSVAMLLESQILYRSGKMDACLHVYRNLQKFGINSLEINFVAGLVSAGRASEVEGTMAALRIKATSSFELAFNTACSLIERNKYKDAERIKLDL